MNDEEPTNKEQTPGADGASIALARDAAFAALADDTPAQPERQPEEDHRKAVNDGRLKKASEDLRAAQEENAKLRKQLEELTAKKGVELDDLRKIEGADKFDDDTLSFVGNAIARAQQRQEERFKAEVSDMRRASEAALTASQSQRKRETWDAALAAAEEAHPGLVMRIAPNGELGQAWARFLDSEDDFGRNRRALFNSALAAGRLAGAKQVFERFAEEVGYSGSASIQTGAPRSAAPAMPLGIGAGGKKTYPSREAVENELNRIASLYRKGLMDRKVYAARSWMRPSSNGATKRSGTRPRRR